MHRTSYSTVEDLLADASFRAWVTGPAAASTGFWEEWVKSNPEMHSIVAEAALVISGPGFTIRELPVSDSVIRQEWDRLHKATEARKAYHGNATPGKNVAKVRRLTLNTTLRYAASLAILIAASFLLWQYAGNPMVEYRTPYGQQMSVTLPDSSVVNLNANSSISFRRRAPRKVWLEGEAFFNVKKKPASGENFRVLTGDLTVEVLGTAFNVVDKGHKTEVVLEEGSVKLNLKRDFEAELFMEPGDLVAFSSQAASTVEKKRVEPEKLTSWTDGVLEFNDVPLIQVMQRIEEIYGYRAGYTDDELQHRKINIPLPADNLEVALTLLSKSLEIEIKMVEDDSLLLVH